MITRFPISQDCHQTGPQLHLCHDQLGSSHSSSVPFSPCIFHPTHEAMRHDQFRRQDTHMLHFAFLEAIDEDDAVRNSVCLILDDVRFGPFFSYLFSSLPVPFVLSRSWFLFRSDPGTLACVPSLIIFFRTDWMASFEVLAERSVGNHLFSSPCVFHQFCSICSISRTVLCVLICPAICVVHAC